MSRRFASLAVFLIVFYGLPLAAAEFDHQYPSLDALLSQYVVDEGRFSRVKYAELKANSVALDTNLARFSAVQKADFEQWSAQLQLAFLINAYNAFTLKLIIDNYPLSSIKDVGSLFRSSWRIEFINLFGESIHLDHIEHDLIRGAKDFNEPRIHFALVCASIGCPKLQPHAYTAEQLDKQLADATQTFLSDESRNHYLAKSNTLFLSPLFKWYAQDFIQSAGSVDAFVGPYLPLSDALKQRISDGKVNISYTDYDWKLNDARH